MIRNAEADQILTPVAGGYRAYSLLNLTNRLLHSTQGFGLAPLHWLTQRGPYQDGETILGMRWDTRTIQILLAESLCQRVDLWDRRWDILDLLRPNRAFGDTVRPHIYRKWLPAGKPERGIDGIITAGDATLTSHDARFVERGLDPGATVTVSGTAADDGPYTVLAVPNDYTVILDPAGGWVNSEANVHWHYRRGWGKRDLYVLLEQGPSFNEGPGSRPYHPNGYREALRFIAHDPFWYGTEQSQTWELDVTFGDLVFDGLGAWFGSVPGIGRWLFAPTFVGETVAVVYWGTEGAKPIIKIDGPAENPLIENTTIGARMEMDYTVAAAETVTIDTLALTVTNNAGTNLMPYLSGDLATFQLSPSPQAPDRQNEVFVSFSSGVAGQSAARMTWRNRHVGI